MGGEEVIKNLKDDGDGFNVKAISTIRLKNVAKAYAWWIAKDCATLAMLKVRVNFLRCTRVTDVLTIEACGLHNPQNADEGLLQRVIHSTVHQQPGVNTLAGLECRWSSYDKKSTCRRRNIHQSHTNRKFGNGSRIFLVRGVQV